MPILTDKDFLGVATLTDEDFTTPQVLSDKDFQLEQKAVKPSKPISKPSTNLFTELAKGLASGTEIAIGESIGSPAIALGESLKSEAKKHVIMGGKDYGEPLAAKQMTAIGQKIESIGTRIRDFFVKNASKGIEAPDEKVMMSEFGQSGYGRKIAYSLGSSVPMMVAAIGVTATTKNPVAGATIFGPQAFGQFYGNARKNGVEVDDAIGLSIANAASQVGLETIPLGGWLKKGGGLFKRVMRGAIQEGLVEEGSQQLVQNSLEGIGWKGKDVNLLEGVTESIIVGTIMGAGMGAAPSSMTVEDIRAQAKKSITKQITNDAASQGLSEEQVKPVIGNISNQVDLIPEEKIVNISDKVQEEVTKDANKEIEQVVGEAAKPPKGTVQVSYSDEDKAILNTIVSEISVARPGYRYVTQNREGEVVKTGYEPSDFELTGYWPKGWPKTVLKSISKALETGQVTAKQKEKVDILLESYKEVQNERAKAEQEGIEQSKIEEAERLGQEEALGIIEAEVAVNWPFEEEFSRRIEQVTTPEELKDIMSELTEEVTDTNKDKINRLVAQVDKKQGTLSQPAGEGKELSRKKALSALGFDESWEGLLSPENEKEIIKKGLHPNQVAITQSGKIKVIKPLIDVQPTIPPTGLRPKVPQVETPALTELKQGLSPEQQQSFLASKSTETLGTAEQIVTEPVISETQKVEEFKLFEQVDALIHKYAKRFGERYVPKGAVGAFYPKSENIFLRGANALFTAIHEVTHYIDIKTGISKAALRTVGMAKNGNPIYDSATKQLRKEMTKFYTDNYPGGQKTHKLEKRMQEGFARFVELYVYKPTMIKENYPYLVQQILQPGGKFFSTSTLDLIRDSREIIGKYQALSPTDKILSRMLAKERKIKDSFLSLPEKIYTEVIDALFPLVKLAKGAGVDMTVDDPSLWARFANNNLSTLVYNNIFGNRGYWIMGPDGNFVKKFDFNWKAMVDSVAGQTDVFGSWLIARDTKFNFDRLNELAKQIEETKEFAGRSATDLKAYKDLVEEAKALKKQLDTNGITRQEAEGSYQEHLKVFTEQAKMYDALVAEDLAMLNHPMVQLLSPEMYAEFSQRKGYAPRKRDFFFNEILGEQSEYVGSVKIGKTKVSSMLPRKGSEMPELNPLYSAILSHTEVMKKATRQMVYNHISNLSESWQGILQPVPLSTAITSQGQISFPQEKDQNIMMARKNYKRYPVLVAKELKAVIDATVTHQNVHAIERWMKMSSRIFVKGTTALYLPFTFANFARDQITAAAQTQTKLKPIISPIKEAILRLNSHSQDAELFKEYLILGGERQTLTKYLDGTPDEVLQIIQGEKNQLEKFVDWVNAGENILAFPAQYSEILTRAAEYVRARKTGDSQIVALEKAGQVTAPFHHKGRMGGALGVSWVTSIPFFNPALQVIAQYSKSLKDPVTQRRAAFVTALVIGAVIASFEYLRYRGTKEQIDTYKSLSPEELNNYIFVPHPNGKSLLRIPIPSQMGALGTMINMALANSQIDARYTGKEMVEGGLSWLPDQFNFINPARQFFSLFPHIAMPMIGYFTGKRFYPEIRDLEGLSVKYLPAGQRSYAYTSKLAKVIGERLGLSPIKIDYLIEGYFGRATRIFIGKSYGNPFVRDIYLYSSRQLQEYYDIKEKNDIAYKNIDTVQDMNERQQIRNIHEKIKVIDDKVSKFRKLEITDKEDSYVATLREQILDGVDTLWEATR